MSATQLAENIFNQARDYIQSLSAEKLPCELSLHIFSTKIILYVNDAKGGSKTINVEGHLYDFQDCIPILNSKSWVFTQPDFTCCHWGPYPGSICALKLHRSNLQVLSEEDRKIRLRLEFERFLRQIWTKELAARIFNRKCMLYWNFPNQSLSLKDAFSTDFLFRIKSETARLLEKALIGMQLSVHSYEPELIIENEGFGCFTNLYLNVLDSTAQSHSTAEEVKRQEYARLEDQAIPDDDETEKSIEISPEKSDQKVAMSQSPYERLSQEIFEWVLEKMKSKNLVRPLFLSVELICTRVCVDLRDAKGINNLFEKEEGWILSGLERLIKHLEQKPWSLLREDFVPMEWLGNYKFSPNPINYQCRQQVKKDERLVLEFERFLEQFWTPTIAQQVKDHGMKMVFYTKEQNMGLFTGDMIHLCREDGFPYLPIQDLRWKQLSALLLQRKTIRIHGIDLKIESPLRNPFILNLEVIRPETPEMPEKEEAKGNPDETEQPEEKTEEKTEERKDEEGPCTLSKASLKTPSETPSKAKSVSKKEGLSSEFLCSDLAATLLREIGTAQDLQRDFFIFYRAKSSKELSVIWFEGQTHRDVEWSEVTMLITSLPLIGNVTVKQEADGARLKIRFS